MGYGVGRSSMFWRVPETEQREALWEAGFAKKQRRVPEFPEYGVPPDAHTIPCRGGFPSLFLFLNYLYIMKKRVQWNILTAAWSAAVPATRTLEHDFGTRKYHVRYLWNCETLAAFPLASRQRHTKRSYYVLDLPTEESQC